MSHKKRHDFIEIPFDICRCKRAVEDTNLLFPFYAFQRPTLAASVKQIIQKNNNLNHLGNLVQLYLYEHDKITNTDNKAVFLLTIK